MSPAITINKVVDRQDEILAESIRTKSRLGYFACKEYRLAEIVAEKVS